MSLVIVFLSENFAMLCGEQRLTYKDGTTYENFKKVFRLNNNLAIGITGELDKYIDFLYPFLFDDGTTGLKINYDEVENLSFDLITEVFDRRFKTYDKSMAMHIIVIGLQNNKFVGRLYSSVDANPEIISPETIPDEFSCRVLGKDIHIENVQFFCGKIRNGSKEGRLWKIFNEVVKEGVKYDKTINKNTTGIILQR